MLQPVVIDGIRTPIGKLNGAMKDIQPEEIAAFLLQKICERSHLDIRLLDAVILGQAKQSSDQPNIARLAALMTKFPLLTCFSFNCTPILRYQNIHINIRCYNLFRRKHTGFYNLINLHNRQSGCCCHKRIKISCCFFIN